MKQIKVKQIKLLNFKGIRKKEILLNKNSTVTGSNGVGKTTLFDAFVWCLFGKDSKGKTSFEIKTLDKNNKVIPKIDHSVKLIISVDSEEIQLERILVEKWVKKRGSLKPEFNGNKVKYFCNEVPLTQKEFDFKISEILSENIFKLITNPIAFNELHWQDQRKILLSIENVSNEKIEPSNKSFEKYRLMSEEALEEERKKLNSQRNRVQKELHEIPSRIDEVSRNTQTDTDFNKARESKAFYEKEVKSIQSEIDDRNIAWQKSQKSNEKLQNLIFSKKEECFEIKISTTRILKHHYASKSSKKTDIKKTLEEANNNLSDVTIKQKSTLKLIDSIKVEIEQFNQKMISLRSDWDSENAKELKINDEDLCCPTCKQKLPSENIENVKIEMLADFKEDKKVALASITIKGKRMKENSNALKESLNIKLKSIVKYNSDILRYQEQISELSKNLEEATDEKTIDVDLEISKELKSNKEYIGLLKSISDTEKLLSNIKGVDVEDLRSKKESWSKEIDVLNTVLSEESNINIAIERRNELEAQENNLAQQVSDIEMEQYNIDQFIKARINMLEKAINQRFSMVTFKLFETQVNGAQVETCKALVNGVPYSDVNTASKVNAGIDIINTLNQFYKVSAPIWVDNRESVTNIIETESQVISLMVSNENNKQLTVI